MNNPSFYLCIRSISGPELSAVIWYLEHLLTCQMSSLPPSVLLHKFWRGISRSQTPVDEYLDCVADKAELGEDWYKYNDICQDQVRSECGEYIGTKADRRNLTKLMVPLTKICSIPGPYDVQGMFRAFLGSTSRLFC